MRVRRSNNIEMKFSHINPENQPEMVDVGDKEVTDRRARARAVMVLDTDIIARMSDGDIQSKKGPVFHTAILAGVMAAKKTPELIPLCHVVPLDDCKISIEVSGDDSVTIDCVARARHRTGVEMEALTGAAVAALTIYDMCKALSREMRIESVRLIEKSGGKRDWKCD
jgi:cyclic pyranopterin phosphate synthase